jgi:multidrug efflux pump subunit AcrA (membrane-fusion protein)
VAYPDFEAEGTVARLGPVVGRSSRTQAVWIEFQSEPERALQHDMLARVTVTTDDRPATLAVPVDAVVRDGLRSFVFVQKTDGSFERRLVETGDSDDRFLEIEAGLELGERIAVRGVSELQTAFAAVR